MSARTRGASAAAGAVTARCASARPRSQTRLAARVAERPRPPLGSHDLVHRLASPTAAARKTRSWARLGRRGPSPATACGSHDQGSQTRLRRRGPSPATSCGSHDLGDQADVLGVGAAAGADDVAPRVEQRGVVARHRLGLELVGRSEEHTSELQSLAYLVCRLLLEKKKKKRYSSLTECIHD